VEKDISVHRAFVYAAGAPGLGQYYAGARLRAAATAISFLAFSLWFLMLLFELAGGIVNRIFDSLNGLSAPAAAPVSFTWLGTAFWGMYFVWLGAMMDAVAIAAAHRRRTGAPAQDSAFWATVISWFCPGAGQVYTGERRLGALVFGAYLTAILLTVPAYAQLVQKLAELLASGQMSTARPLAVIDAVHALFIHTNYSFGKLLQALVRLLAVAAAIDALAGGPLKADSRWSAPSTSGALALAGLGWLCPGAGQLLQTRRRLGWFIAAAYIGSRAIIWLLPAAGLTTAAQADSAAWVPAVLQWGSLIEAPVWMAVHRRRQPAP